MRTLSNYSFSLTTCIFLLLAISCQSNKNNLTTLTNPILPDYYADPSIVELNGEYYIYVTIDPWGGDSLACWKSADFKNWELTQLTWPTKQAWSSKLTTQSIVLSPLVIKRKYKYYN